ncbi:IS701 family transposase [Nonomuraea sp. NPDC049400]|uniref:IS701 family transposase n=1 Tax=Nonomuraea sp. NPDC049400 TaxID=3364352 RepID=UPI00379B1767
MRSWVSGLDDLFARVAGRFPRVEPRRQARAYVTGLLAPVERKNGWQLAEAAGDAAPDRMQRLLNNARWDPRGMRDDLREYVFEQLGAVSGVLIVDETGFIKKGTGSAGVQRQYSGTAGRVENCQLGVFLAYASHRGRALIDAELYLPKSWLEDPERCARADIPDHATFVTKPALAQAMLERVLATDSAPAQWVTADEAYGQDHKFRSYLEKQQVGYVVAVPRNQSLGTGIGYGNTGSRADDVVADAPPEAWKRLSAGDGAKGPRLYDWAMATLPPHLDDDLGGPTARKRWLLVRRNLTENDSGELELAYYLCHGPAGTTIDQLVRIAGARWAIEECFQAAKNEVGLDQYQVRRFDGWHRHITLAMLAHAYLAATAAHAPKAAAAWSPSPQPRSAVSWHT